MTRFQLIGVLLVAVSGCMGEKGVTPSLRSPETTMGPVSASPMNALIAVGETLTVTVHAKTLTGAPVTSYDSVNYIFLYPTDTQYVHVSPAGVLTGVKRTLDFQPVKLWMIAFKDGAVGADLTLIHVSETALSNPTLSIQPGPSDSTRWPALAQKNIDPLVWDPVTENTVSGVSLRFEFGPSDSTGVVCFSDYLSRVPDNITAAVTGKSPCTFRGSYDWNGLNAFIGVHPETIWVHANLMAYGTMSHDSVQYTITNPPDNYIMLSPMNLSGGGGYYTLNIAVAPGGTVTWYNLYDPSFGTSIDVTFGHPEAATAWPDTVAGPSGNITGMTAGNMATRRFPTSGTYEYTYTIVDGAAPFKGTTGRGKITVE